MNMFQRIVVFLTFLPILANCCYADFGVSGWGIFRMVDSAQFGGISITAPDNGDITGVLYNPAILGMTGSREISFISGQGVAGDKFGSAIYAQPLNKKCMIAAGGAYYDAGQVELNWIDNGVLNSDTVSAQKDTLGFISLQRMLGDSWSVGVTLKGASSVLAQRYSANAYAADAGLMYSPADNFAMSLVAQDLGSATAFMNKADPLPTGYYAGCGYILQTRSLYFMPAVGVTYLANDRESVPEAGLEIGGNMLSLNVGYRSYTGESTIHIGIQISCGDITFGYAFLPGANLDPVQRLSVNYRFKPAPAPVVKPVPVKVVEVEKPVIKPTLNQPVSKQIASKARQTGKKQTTKPAVKKTKVNKVKDDSEDAKPQKQPKTLSDY